MKTRTVIAIVTATMTFAACGGSSDSSADTDTSTASDAAVNFNDDDVMFAQMMIPHHEQAIELADMALDPSIGARPEIVELATQIKGAQDPEIEQMKALLASWGQSVTADQNVDHSSMMGGMLATAELDALGLLTGAEFDVAWAKAMILHHEGAIAMANDVLAAGINGDIRVLAEAIIAGQAAEIDVLKTLAS
ncbi:MAG: DUF305 domain-containing protein [Actinobacteria bacterium]|nr:DUF305 domain-containing protein [Actinomycetota bacterium]NDG77128.1 DUF305 domain-containing protein [Acidimicrobiia bacterium]NBP18189.1 DUF305 domain-containing protein [Actinomycetota bacterium]NBR75872.1 DUF305 domain-containing protein [Actinomycetota bacterium]NBR92025.1 DUF305 domain-containing protein [Actinomycetota bacterium]